MDEVCKYMEDGYGVTYIEDFFLDANTGSELKLLPPVITARLNV